MDLPKDIDWQGVQLSVRMSGVILWFSPIRRENLGSIIRLKPTVTKDWWCGPMTCCAQLRQKNLQKVGKKTQLFQKPVIGLLRNFNLFAYKMEMNFSSQSQISVFTAEKSISGKLKSFWLFSALRYPSYSPPGSVVPSKLHD